MERLLELYENALRNYKESRSDYDAGVVEGLKRAIEVMKLESLQGICDIMKKYEKTL